MNHLATKGPAAVTTVVALVALILGVGLGVPAALYAITRDLEVTGRTMALAGVIAGIAADLLWAAPKAQALVRAYRRRP